MIRPWTIWPVLQFEFRRMLAWKKLLPVAILVLFPLIIISLIQCKGGFERGGVIAEITLFVLIPEVLCLLLLLLWAAPVVHAELEAKTWPYLAVRPSGRGSVLAGKYLAAVGWAILAGWLSLALCLVALSFAMDVSYLVMPLGGLIVFACLVYGALYILISVLFLQKALVAAVAYTAVMETLIAWLPAMINHFSVQYHLRCLMMKWIDRPELQQSRQFNVLFLSDYAAWQHMLLLLGAAAVLLTIAILVLSGRQLVIAREE